MPTGQLKERPVGRLRDEAIHPSSCSVAAARLLRFARNDGQLIRRHFPPMSEITPLATSLFQMNSTTSAPIVEVM